MNKNIVIGIVVVVVVVGGIYWFMRSGSGTSSAPTYGTTNVPTQTQGTAPTPGATASPTTYNVTIQNFAFTKASINVKKGDTIVWTNKDAMAHTVTGDYAGPSSPTIGPNGTYSYTFNTVGIFDYHCSIHPSMKGTVLVME